MYHHHHHHGVYGSTVEERSVTVEKTEVSCSNEVNLCTDTFPCCSWWDVLKWSTTITSGTWRYLFKHVPYARPPSTSLSLSLSSSFSSDFLFLSFSLTHPFFSHFLYFFLALVILWRNAPSIWSSCCSDPKDGESNREGGGGLKAACVPYYTPPPPAPPPSNDGSSSNSLLHSVTAGQKWDA